MKARKASYCSRTRTTRTRTLLALYSHPSSTRTLLAALAIYSHATVRYPPTTGSPLSLSSLLSPLPSPVQCGVRRRPFSRPPESGEGRRRLGPRMRLHFTLYTWPSPAATHTSHSTRGQVIYVIHVLMVVWWCGGREGKGAIMQMQWEGRLTLIIVRW